jgi:condensin complex subunit 1
MDSSIDFDINDALKRYLNDPSQIECPEADSRLIECDDDSEALNNALINNVLNPIIDAVAESPEALSRTTFFDSTQYLLR